MYGSLTLSFALFYILSTFRRININKALENANIYLISLILLIIDAGLLHFCAFKEPALVCLFSILIFIVLLISMEKRYAILGTRFQDAIHSLNWVGKIDPAFLKLSYIKRTYFQRVKQYHFYFWIVLLMLEILSGEQLGIGALLKSIAQLWNDTAVIGIVIILLIFYSALHYLVVWISGKQSVHEEGSNE
jgi:hypothetical protein